MSGGGSAASSSAGVEAPLKLPAVMPSSVTIEPVAVLPGHGDRVWHVSWCPTTNVLASASGDGTVRVWGKTAGGWGLLSVLEGEHDGHTIRHVSWSPSGTYLALACFDHTASVWRRSDEEEGGWEFEIEGILDGHESEVKCVAWATETTLATCSRDHTVWVWDRLDEGEYECGGVLTGHSQDVKHCTWLLPTSSAEDGARPLVISCGYDETVRVWADSLRSDDWHCVQTLKQHEGTVWAAAAQRLEPTMAEVRAAEEAGQPLPQPLLCTCSDDLRVLFWRRNAQGRFENVAAASGFSERSIFDVDWAPAGGAPLVACASGDDSVTLLGLSYAEAERQVHVGVVARLPAAHASDVNSVAFAHNGSLSSEEGLLLASAGDDNTVRIWRVRCQE